MAEYNVTITNGSGSQAMKAGTYDVVATSAPGYDTTSLSPTTFTASTSAGSATFTLSATGTLTFVVNETGASGGTPVESGSIVMTDSTGTTQYGSPVSIGSNGEAIFQNVPFGSASEPYSLYFKQLSTDANHNLYENVISVSMAAQTQTEYIQNTPIATQTIALTDANYANLPVASATLSFESENE